MSERHETARRQLLDAAIAEAAGTRPSPDLLTRIAERLATESASPARASPWRGRVLAAAVLLGGIAVVATVALWKNDATRRMAQQPAPPPDATAQDPQLQEPQPQEPGPQQPQPQEPRPADPASPETPPAAQQGQDPPRPATTAADRQADALVRQLELPEQYDTSLAGLAALGATGIAALDRAIAAEHDRGRADVKARLQLLRYTLELRSAAARFGLPPGPVTIIADYSDNRIVFVDGKGKARHIIDDVFGAWDAELTAGGTLLITEFSVSRVRELDRDGNVVWEFGDLKNPYDADRLPDGNTLIADTFGGRVVEVDPKGRTVWEYAKNIRAFDCDRLANGNTLIADVMADRVIEVNPAGDIVWEVGGMPNVHDADRLPSGNTLITLRNLQKVVEVNPKGEVVWELTGLSSPSDADRLPGGNTIVAENTRVREFDEDGKCVWEKQMTWAVEVNRY